MKLTRFGKWIEKLNGLFPLLIVLLFLQKISFLQERGGTAYSTLLKRRPKTDDKGISCLVVGMRIIIV